MNGKITLTCMAMICTVVMLSPWTCLSVHAVSTTNFLPTATFAIPENNSTIDFAYNGSYETATLENNTWFFTNLQLTPSNLTSNDNPLLNSPNNGNLSISAQDSNVTITSFDRLLTPNPENYLNNTGEWLTPGWLNYTINGVGNQTVKIQFGAFNETSIGVGTQNWPVNVFAVFINGRNAPYNNSWTFTGDNSGIVNGVGVIVNGASSNVSIEYAWYPVPSSASTISPEKSPAPIGVSINNSVFYVVVAAIMVFAVVVATDLLLRLKKKQKREQVNVL